MLLSWSVCIVATCICGRCSLCEHSHIKSQRLDQICSTNYPRVDFIMLVLFSVTAFHAVTSFYLEICAYFVKLQNGSELDADIEVFTPASVDTGWVEFYISDIFVHYLRVYMLQVYVNIACVYILCVLHTNMLTMYILRCLNHLLREKMCVVVAGAAAASHLLWSWSQSFACDLSRLSQCGVI